jgi:hydroxymethylpyrimidine pyrophosphatase-like HAD family hydrolase
VNLSARATRFKLLATDLDGTLLDRSGAIHERDRRAIAELQRRGVAVTIVTGRMYSGTRDLARSLLLDGPIGCLDGSAIVAVREDRHLVSRALAGEAGRVLRASLGGGSPAVFILGHDQIFHDARSAQFAPYVRGWTSRITHVDDVTAAPHWETEAGVAGVIAVGTKDEIDALVSGLAPAAALVAPVMFPVSHDTLPGHWAMMARAAGATKGSALQWIAAHHGIDVREVVAVGDWLNDVSMFRVAGRSFAMAHAIEEVKAAATEHLRADVTTGGGIAEAAERAGLL